jgi:hypothetical protein
MVLMKIICGVLLWYGRLVEDQASAAHEWMVWVLTKCEGDQRRQKDFANLYNLLILQMLLCTKVFSLLYRRGLYNYPLYIFLINHLVFHHLSG